MSASSEAREEGREGFQIGTVAQLTGLDPHTIRAWERRHGAVEPTRTASGRRVYDETAIQRLHLLKALVDCGEAIRKIAHLDEQSLRDRLEELAGLAAAPPEASPGPQPLERARIGLLAPAITTMLRSQPGLPAGLDVVAEGEHRDTFLAALQRNPCDVLVLALELLGPEPTVMLRACMGASRAQIAVVVYSFAQRGQLMRLSQAGAKLLRGPLPLDALLRSTQDLLVIEEARRRHGQPPTGLEVGPGKSPERLFDDEQLARLSDVSSGIDCECPHHLASLVTSLNAFETYSRTCENRDDADAALHSRLAVGTGHARATLERLLAEVCEHEGLRV